MKPRSLPPTYASEAEAFRRIAETVNGILQALPDNGTTANRPSSPLTGQQYFDTTLGHWIGWNGSAWCYVGTGEVIS